MGLPLYISSRSFYSTFFSISLSSEISNVLGSLFSLLILNKVMIGFSQLYKAITGNTDSKKTETVARLPPHIQSPLILGGVPVHILEPTSKHLWKRGLWIKAVREFSDPL